MNKKGNRANDCYIGGKFMYCDVIIILINITLQKIYTCIYTENVCPYIQFFLLEVRVDDCIYNFVIKLEVVAKRLMKNNI